jgi:hypothetical protein
MQNSNDRLRIFQEFFKDFNLNLIEKAILDIFWYNRLKMVEPITVMIIGCVISAVGILLATVGTFITVFTTLQIQKMSETQQKKYQKAKEKIMNKYTFAATPDEYIKIACLLHLVKSEAKQCSHLTIDCEFGSLQLMVSLQNIAVKYKPFNGWYTCKCHYDDNDKSFWVTFLDVKSRDRFQTYVNNVRAIDLVNKCKEFNQTQDEICCDSESESEEKAPSKPKIVGPKKTSASSSASSSTNNSTVNRRDPLREGWFSPIFDDIEASNIRSQTPNRSESGSESGTGNEHGYGSESDLQNDNNKFSSTIQADKPLISNIPKRNPMYVSTFHF